ncbi:MAG TPA: hypothetical protein VMS22_12105 [Candidatus Eisenbacteria bacterium]|nr:hypothetical protein [Candidatus Eisenbacteria bacterium]
MAPGSIRLVVFVTLVVARLATAQITGVTAIPNPANSPDETSGPGVNPSFERESFVTVTAATASAFTTRYKALVTADSGLFGDARLEHLDSDYTISFSVTAPGAYRVVVATHRKGDLHLIEDNIFVADHFADMSALAGSFTGGTLTTGTLNLADPGRANDIPLVFDPITVAFDQTASAAIFGVSNGSAQAHTLRFTWNQEAFSPAAGDEAAVRMGGTSDDSTETAGDYPGNPPRVQADDGHFVTVTLTSLCGNGVLDGGPSYLEQCDDGAGNGTQGSCCTSTCQLRTAGTTCRAAVGGCDNTEVCNGVDGACPLDSVMPAFVLCRPAAGSCDLAEACDGLSPLCPDDTKSTGVCRPAAGVCDLAESCDGFNNECPPDQKSTALCRAATGQCDVAESCDGFNPNCPTDQLVPNGTPCDDGDACSSGEACSAGVCGGATGGCGPCETCEPGGCVVGPKLGCRVPISTGRAKLLLKDSSVSTSDLVSWKWTQGAETMFADFGDPMGTTDYTLCVFDQNGTHLVISPDMPAGGACGPLACWKPIGTKGFKYKDKDRTPEGADKMTLLSGAAGKAKISFKGKGPNLGLALPPTGLTTPVRVQLQAEGGACWESTFSAAQQNTATSFKAKSD